MKQQASHPTNGSRETQARLQIYATLLLRWNKTINLVSRGEEANLWVRHIDDSLALVPLLPSEMPFGVDLGSGGGFPGLVLAIATGRPFHLVEADQRKASFLREAARATGAPAIIHPMRIQELPLTGVPLFTARALAPLTTLLDWVAPKLAPDGICLFPKGRNHTSELTAAATQWQMNVEKIPSQTESGAVVLRIRDISPCPT